MGNFIPLNSLSIRESTKKWLNNLLLTIILLDKPKISKDRDY
jgi:hypothetical protein